MPTTETYRNNEQKFFQDHLKGMQKRDLKLYHLYREGFKRRIHSTIPGKYIFLYAYDLINLNLIPDREKTIKELLYLHSYTREREARLHSLLTHWIGDMFLHTGKKEEACKWHHKTKKEEHINIILSYYNYEKELEEMPLEYFAYLLGLPEKKETATSQSLEEFAKIVLFLNERVEEELSRSLLDYLNIRPMTTYSYELFQGALYGGERDYLITPFKRFLPYERMTQIFQILYFYIKKNQKKISGEGAEIWRKNIPRKIRGYLAEWNILQIVEEEKRRPKKKIFLDENKIQRTMEEQKETVSELHSIMDHIEKEEESTSYQPIHDLEDLFQNNKREDLPELKPEEKKLIKHLWDSPVDGDRLKNRLGRGLFLHQVINDLNEQFYPYLGAPFIEQREVGWSIAEEHKPFLETIDLTLQEES